MIDFIATIFNIIHTKHKGTNSMKCHKAFKPIVNLVLILIAFLMVVYEFFFETIGVAIYFFLEKNIIAHIRKLKVVEKTETWISHKGPNISLLIFIFGPMVLLAPINILELHYLFQKKFAIAIMIKIVLKICGGILYPWLYKLTKEKLHQQPLYNWCANKFNNFKNKLFDALQEIQAYQTAKTWFKTKKQKFKEMYLRIKEWYQTPTPNPWKLRLQAIRRKFGWS